MNVKILKAMLAASVAVAALFGPALAHADDSTPDYVSPGIGTLFIHWLLG